MSELITFDYQAKTSNYIGKLNSNCLSIENSYSDKNIIDRLILLDGAYSFFNDLYKYFPRMELSDSEIENIVLDLDDLIDEFEEFKNKKSDKSLLNDYYKKCDKFYSLLINLQYEMSGFLSDKKYANSL